MGKLTIWLIAAANGTSALGNTALFTGVVWILVNGHGDARTAGFMMAVCGATTVLLSPAAGALLDRPGGIRMILAADYGACAVLSALVLFGDGSSLTALWIAMLATAVGGLAYGPGLQMLIGRFIPADRRRNANAKLHSASRIGLILGPLLGGAVVSFAGQRGLLAFDAATFLVSGIILTVIYLRPSAREHLRRNPSRKQVSFADSLRFMISNRIVRWVLVVGATVNMLTSGFAILLPVLAARTDGSGVSYGVLYSIYQGGMLLLAVTLSSERSSRLPAGRDSLAVACSLAVFSAGFITAVLADNLWVLGASVFAVGAGLSATSLFADTKFLVSVPEEMQGRVFSLANSILGSLRPAGSALGGVLASISTVAMGVIGATAAAGCAVFMAARKPLEPVHTMQEAHR
ncbi:MFS transporter [Nocardia sp. NPDC019395]|uniref:MFS transporter n=1 Tax=Nocardia sp. NPDC019395 TaxID=3154686 RepID=UPI0033CD0777